MRSPPSGLPLLSIYFVSIFRLNKFKTRQIGLMQIAENMKFIVHLLHIAVVNNEMVATVGAVIYAVVRVR